MILETSEVKLYYEKCGEGQPLIMLHGSGEDCTIFKKAISVLKNHFTVYAIDTRNHGKSSKVSELHYEDMANDVFEFITKLNIENPIVYGFSDGGIIALILALHHQELLSRIIISGVNTKPNGLMGWQTAMYKFAYFFTKAKRIKVILTEPNISNEELKTIQIPVDMTGGSNDMIKQSHFKEIADNIPNSTLTIFKNELHGTYIVNSTKIADYILKICDK
ncbi:MAG: alpha/beta hydrolase [Eubacterium sp.]|nr:alpha/beta hydrolase [Eubacterium sp.]